MSEKNASMTSVLAIGAVALAGFGALVAILGMNGTSKSPADVADNPKPVVPAQVVAASSTASASQTPDNIKQIIRDYLTKENPEILMEMQAALEARMAALQEERTKKAVAENREALFGGKTSLVVGNPKGDVTVVEFFDYNCGFCKRAVEHIEQLRKSDPKVRIVMKEMPIFGANSEAAARIAIAAKKQGKYWELHRGLLAANGQATKESAYRIAQELGLDMEQLKKDAGSRETVEIIRETQQLGRRLGIQGTPHFFVNDQMIAGAPQDLLSQIKALVAKEREKG